MRVLPLYERDPYLAECRAEVVSSGDEDGRFFAVLSDTVLYPEGGGQPADRGFLDETPVVDVKRTGGVIRHFVGRPVATGPVTVRLDWARRFDHMQQHTGQHLLTAVAQDRFGWPTTAFHLGETVSDIELAVSRTGPERLRALEEAVAAEIRAARPVTARHVSPEEFAALPVRTRGLPEGHAGSIRLVEIEGIDLNTCGGTHLRSTAEIELIAFTGAEAIRGGVRLFFAAGGRARARLAGHEERNAALRKLLGAPDDGLVAAVEERLERLKEAGRILRAKEEEEAEAKGLALATGPARLVRARFPGQGAAFLGLVSKSFQAAAREKVALLASSDESGAYFLLAAGPDAPLDVQAAGREMAALLGGKGGGSGRLFQGKGPSLDAFDSAFARLSQLAG